jgi:hypothetical protein
MAVESTLAAVDRRRSYTELRVSAGGVEIITPKSIAFAAVGQKEFNRIREEVEHVIEDAVGVSANELLTARVA